MCYVTSIATWVKKKSEEDLVKLSGFSSIVSNVDMVLICKSVRTVKWNLVIIGCQVI